MSKFNTLLDRFNRSKHAAVVGIVNTPQGWSQTFIADSTIEALVVGYRAWYELVFNLDMVSLLDRATTDQADKPSGFLVGTPVYTDAYIRDDPARMALVPAHSVTAFCVDGSCHFYTLLATLDDPSIRIEDTNNFRYVYDDGRVVAFTSKDLIDLDRRLPNSTVPEYGYYPSNKDEQ